MFTRRVNIYAEFMLEITKRVDVYARDNIESLMFTERVDVY